MPESIRLRSGPWPADEVAEYLDGARIPLRIASQGTYPVVQSLWFLRDGSQLWCATQTDSVLAQRLRRDDRCGFEVSADAPPYRGVRGTGHATLDPRAAADVLPRLIARYLGPEPGQLADWLMSRIASEVAVRIDRLTVTSWDYSGRM